VVGTAAGCGTGSRNSVSTMPTLEHPRRRPSSTGRRGEMLKMPLSKRPVPGVGEGLGNESNASGSRPGRRISLWR